jgi:hypothetical protein
MQEAATKQSDDPTGQLSKNCFVALMKVHNTSHILWDAHESGLPRLKCHAKRLCWDKKLHRIAIHLSLSAETMPVDHAGRL